MAIQLLCDVNYIKSTGYIDENVDEKIVRNVIKECQDLYIHTVLGTGLYNEILTQLTAGTLTALNRTLLNSYVLPALKYYVLYDGAPVLHLKITNKSIVKRTGDNSTAVETTDVKWLMDHFLNRAEEYAERARKYLVENRTSYPLYDNPGNGVDTIHPKRDIYTVPIHLGRSKPRNLPPDKYDPGDYQNC